MPMQKATGVDGISTRIVKAATTAISSSLARLINCCIDNNCIQSAWKLAKVVAMYKGKGSKGDVCKYCPISVLPLLSKILEKHIYTALYSHLKENNLLYNLQSGFRKTYSTETALIRLVDQLLWNFENDHIHGLALIDYKKAFDLIDNKFLVTKLKSYGISQTNLTLLNIGRLPKTSSPVCKSRRFQLNYQSYKSWRALRLNLGATSVIGIYK